MGDQGLIALEKLIQDQQYGFEGLNLKGNNLSSDSLIYVTKILQS